MIKLNEVLEFIKNSNLQELKQIQNTVSIRKSEVVYDFKMSFRVGDMVSINHKKINPNNTFRVIKINSKNIRVQGDKGSYTVAPSLLVKK
tara:strand:- start:697 stop:966 length:270 start_codon:yes stop_codon:yes gene_type:complete